MSDCNSDQLPISPILNNEVQRSAAAEERQKRQRTEGGFSQSEEAKEAAAADEEEKEAAEDKDVWVPKPEWDIPPEPDPEWGVRVPRCKRGPVDPTEEEIKVHNVTHMPFRSWCPHCVAAAAKASPHERRGDDEEDPTVPNHHVDY